MGNRQNGSSSSQVPAHADSDSSASAHSTSGTTQSTAAAAAPSAPPDSGASAPQTETVAGNTHLTQDVPQTQAGRPQGTAQGELQSTTGMYFCSTHSFRLWIGI